MNKSLDKAIRLCDASMKEYRGYIIDKRDNGGGAIRATPKLEELAKKNNKKINLSIPFYRGTTLAQAKKSIDLSLLKNGMNDLI